MIHWKRTLAGLALGVALGGTAHAKALYTSPALGDFTNEAVLCVAQNIGTTTQWLSIGLMHSLGNVVKGGGMFPLAGGEMAIVESTANDGTAYCKFTLMGSGKTIRAHAAYVDPGSHQPTMIVPAR